MSDLIRKSDVLDLLYGIFDKYKMSTDKNTSIGKSFGTAVFEEIRNMPTAYSVDKVVEEIENMRFDFQEVSNNKYHVLQIVKHGGVSDYVCEWKVKSNYYVTKCSHDTDVMYGLKQDFKYCPYCGKKIKVVE